MLSLDSGWMCKKMVIIRVGCFVIFWMTTGIDEYSVGMGSNS